VLRLEVAIALHSQFIDQTPSMEGWLRGLDRIWPVLLLSLT
jgi:hypothetical protein